MRQATLWPCPIFRNGQAPQSGPQLLEVCARLARLPTAASGGPTFGSSPWRRAATRPPHRRSDRIQYYPPRLLPASLALKPRRRAPQSMRGSQPKRTRSRVVRTCFADSRWTAYGVRPKTESSPTGRTQQRGDDRRLHTALPRRLAEQPVADHRSAHTVGPQNEVTILIVTE